MRARARARSKPRRRAWCALELFVANLERGSTYLHDIYTPFEHSRGGRPHAAVGLVDGFAAIDRANPLSKSAAKSEREAAFPADALARAESFELARAEASEPSDLAAIRAWVGDEAPLLDATVRARFGIVRLTQLVAAGVPDGNVRLRALLDALRCSRLRKLSCELAQPSAGAVARLCASLPASLAELRLVSAGPSVALPISTSLRSDSLQLLCVLNLPYCALGDEEGAELGAALGAAGCRLVELRLRFVPRARRRAARQGPPSSARRALAPRARIARHVGAWRAHDGPTMRGAV